jgi:uncharacterized protein (TIGR02118 family)
MTTTGRMVVIYRTPRDPAAFDKHYHDVHVPLAHKLPGLRRYAVSQRPIATPAGDPEPYLVAILHFDSLDALRQAFGTPEGRACAADRRILAPQDEDVQMYLYEAVEV